MAKRGFREKEPVEVNFEENPSALRDVLGVHIDELANSISDLGELFGLGDEEVQALYPVPKQRPRLRLVS
jgi:hypothetical protein